MYLYRDYFKAKYILFGYMDPQGNVISHPIELPEAFCNGNSTCNSFSYCGSSCYLKQARGFTGLGLRAWMQKGLGFTRAASIAHCIRLHSYPNSYIHLYTLNFKPQNPEPSIRPVGTEMDGLGVKLWGLGV